jgi:hypothetical protein
MKSTCDTMKKSLILSAVLLSVGILMELIVLFLSFETILPALFTFAGAAAIFLGIVIALAASASTMIPKVNQSIDACQH